MSLAYEEVVDFIAAGTTPAGVVSFAPSESAKARVAELIHLQKTGSLPPDEQMELEQFLQLEHVLRLAKARARLNLTAGTN